jgi:hypothetical protein
MRGAVPWIMRTTLDLDADVVKAARELAKERGRTLGQVVSELARGSLAGRRSLPLRNGVPLFPAKTSLVRPDLALVNSLRNER